MIKWKSLINLIIPSCHFGGGGKAPVAAPAPPPVTERTTEVKQASRDTARIMRNKKGMRASILAGETGGYNPNGNTMGSKSLLG